jgi:ornithine decarboxylase
MKIDFSVQQAISSASKESQNHDKSVITAYNADLKLIPRSLPNYTLANGVSHMDRIISEIDSNGPEGAFFIADLNIVKNQYVRWVTNLPRIQPFYAVKCNPDPYVVSTLAELGSGFDCASMVKPLLNL